MWRFLTPVVEAAVLSGRLPRPVVNAAFAAAVSAVRVIGFISSSAASAAWLEFGNILEAIRHFATSRFDTVSLAVHDEGLAALGGAEKAGRSLSFGEPTFEALWALEGLGIPECEVSPQSEVKPAARSRHGHAPSRPSPRDISCWKHNRSGAGLP